MDLGALIAYGRRVEKIRDASDLVDVSSDALREACGATVAIVVVTPAESRPEASCSGQFPDPFVPSDDSTSYRLGDLERLLTREGAAVQRAVSLGQDPDEAGFLLLGWTDPGARVDDAEAALQLAAGFIRHALRQGQLERELAASRESVTEIEGQVAGTGHLYMLGEMASGVAHDFNNTLTTILGTTEWLLQNATLEDETREDLTRIRTAATDAAVYAHRLQLAARQIPPGSGRPTQAGSIEAPEPPGSTEQVDLSAIATHMRALSRPRWAQLIERGVPLEFVVDAPPVSAIRGRAPEIRELLLNLVFNAIDAMEDGGGRLTLTVREADGHVSLSVGDQGAGISDDVRARVFEPFFTTKGKRGSGLGLSICSRIAEQHGGTLGVDTAVSEGTTFTLTLPADTTQETEAERPESDIRHARRILLIDDQPDVRESVSDMLKALGHEVTVAADGQQGLELIQQGAFDVVLTDLRMPGLDGLDVAKRARSIQPEIPVVLLTGRGTLFENAEPEAVAVVLPKPPTLHSLSEAIIRAATDVAA